MVPFLSVSAAPSSYIKSSPLRISAIPSRSSSKFRHPSPLWSMLLNTSLRWATSLGERCTAIAVKAAYFNFWWCWNFLRASTFILFNFYPDIIPGPITPYLLNARIHGCYNASSAESLLSGLHISLLIKSLAESLTSSHSSPSNSN